MQVDFYQLGGAAAEQVIASISEKLLAQDGRLLIVADEESLLARLDRLLWGEQGDSSFLPHALAGGTDDARQPILLSTSPDAPNLARNILFADGKWREAALAFDRAFYLFDGDVVQEARQAWKQLAGREGVERRYWARVDGRWKQQA
jgi:DNA polymerase-3 subunit chi